MSTRNVVALNSRGSSTSRSGEGVASSAPQEADSNRLLAAFSNHRDTCSYFQTRQKT